MLPCHLLNIGNTQNTSSHINMVTAQNSTPLIEQRAVDNSSSFETQNGNTHAISSSDQMTCSNFSFFARPVVALPNVFEHFFNFYSQGMNKMQMLPKNLAKEENKEVIKRHIAKKAAKPKARKLQWAHVGKFEMQMSIDSGVWKRGLVLDMKTAKTFNLAREMKLPNPKTCEEKAVANYASQMMSCTIKKRLVDRLQRDVKKEGKDLVVGTGEMMYFDFNFHKRYSGERTIKISKRKSSFEVHVIYSLDSCNEFVKSCSKTEKVRNYVTAFEYEDQEIELSYKSLKLKLVVGSGIIYCKWVQNIDRIKEKNEKNEKNDETVKNVQNEEDVNKKMSETNIEQ